MRNHAIKCVKIRHCYTAIWIIAWQQFLFYGLRTIYTFPPKTVNLRILRIMVLLIFTIEHNNNYRGKKSSSRHSFVFDCYWLDFWGLICWFWPLVSFICFVLFELYILCCIWLKSFVSTWSYDARLHLFLKCRIGTIIGTIFFKLFSLKVWEGFSMLSLNCNEIYEIERS